jgi:predicted transcriptional regulator
LEIDMPDKRVITANLSETLIARLDKVAERSKRDRSWIIRQALLEWLAEDQRRHELTVEAMKSMDEGQMLTQVQIEQWAEQRKRERRERREQSED